MTQPELAKLIIDSVNVWALAVFALIGVLSPAVGLLTSGAIAAGWLSADSGWAKFAAKVFSITLQAKSEAKLSGQVARVGAVIEESKKS